MVDHITIDGEEVTLPHGIHDVMEVLAAAGVHARTHDLLRIDSEGPVTTHRTGDKVVTAHGDKFVTVRISSSVA